MSPGDVFVVLAVLTAIVGQLSGVSGGVGNVRRAVDVARRLAWVLDRAADDAAEQNARTGQVPERLVEGIRLTGVGFTYPGASEPALHDLDLLLPAGAVVAFVGDNGAGKTTLLKLLFGFYEPNEGVIAVDGTPLATINIDAWRSRTSACFQDYVNPHFFAREVVGIGDLTQIDDDAAITSAAARARATDVIETLPNGLETQLGSTFQGHDVSGGQWQMLAIGRAMLRDEPLLLALDEPTSALDPLAEHELFEAYAIEARERSARNGTITVLISHRFSTVRIADLIVVVDNGTIREQGTHADLMVADGMYAELYRLQARHYR
jgi:ATP-binding cassette subfamily B protein